MFTTHFPARRSIRALLFDHDGKLVFLELHRPNREVLYLTFGGGVEDDESAEETLHRELKEELDAEAVIGKEFIGVPAHRYFMAKITREGDNPFTLGPEFQEGRDETYAVKRVSFEEATADDFNLQPEILKPFLTLYQGMLVRELAKLG